VNLNLLCKERDYILIKKVRELKEKEVKLHNQRRDKKIKKKKLEEEK
jgi:hypothetical protein